MSPLDNLQQQLYDERGGAHTRYLVLSRAPPSRSDWEVSMWTGTAEESGNANPRVWAGLGDAGDDDRQQEIADAIKAGMLSVQARGNGGLKLLVHVGSKPVSVYLDPADVGDCVADLLGGAFSLVARPEVDSSSSSVRVLKGQLAEKDAEITSLNSRIATLRATIQRQGGSSGRQDVQPVVKTVAPPANASLLQPNQKRRKRTEDEFMGSSDDEDDDESEEEYDED